MKLSVVGMCSLLFGGGEVIGCAFTSLAVAQEPVAEVQCGATAVSQLQTTLYFGLARPKGSVSELEWQVFLRDEVTTRFPEGLTVWEANGQWRRPDSRSTTNDQKFSYSFTPTRQQPVRHRPSSDGPVRSSNRNQCCGSQRAFASPHKCRLRDSAYGLIQDALAQDGGSTPSRATFRWDSPDDEERHATPHSRALTSAVRTMNAPS